MKNTIREFGWICERVFHKYSQFEKIPQKYCDGIMLTQAEIHAIVAICDQEGIGVTQLARIRGITKGAVSQMVYRLVDKGLVEKRVSPDSDAAVSLFLTDKGKQAQKEHQKRHEESMRAMSSIPDETLSMIIKFFEGFEKELDKKIARG